MAEFAAHLAEHVLPHLPTRGHRLGKRVVGGFAQTMVRRHHARRRVACASLIAGLSCYMIRSFKDTGTGDLFFGRETKAARKLLPTELQRQASKKLDALDSAAILDDLRVPPGNRLEALHGDRRGQHSIRINDQYRICFRWTDSGPEDVEVVDYH